ncbi:MAG: hypothetical protein EKK54_11600 [Neisseriaceae bacterium]|nr:MAG: hypothetical protein EKK54_11600 [Neisseriaceae bacterium]
MSKEILLAATTSAAKSKGFALKQASKDQKATIQVIGLTSSNKAYLQMENLLNPGTFVNVKKNGSDVYCDSGNNIIYVSGNGVYRIDKQGSDNVGVAVVSDMDLDVYIAVS